MGDEALCGVPEPFKGLVNNMKSSRDKSHSISTYSNAVSKFLESTSWDQYLRETRNRKPNLLDYILQHPMNFIKSQKIALSVYPDPAHPLLSLGGAAELILKSLPYHMQAAYPTYQKNGRFIHPRGSL